MKTNGKVYVAPYLETTGANALRAPAVLGATGDQDKFNVYSYALNKKAPAGTAKENEDKGGIIDDNNEKHSFPGNISPEGLFYSPFYEVTLKELEDELQSIQTRLINFNPSANTTTVSVEGIECYNPETGVMEIKNLSVITIVTPAPYEFISQQPFCIYDVQNDMTYRGYLDKFEPTADRKSKLSIITDAEIISSGLTYGRYIISALNGNAPVYAEYIPASSKLIWRNPKKMSDLTSDSPIYNMPFTNGRFYIHKNLNVFVRRQDPNNDYKLFKPSEVNPLRRFQVEGDAKLDFDYIQQIIDTMVDAC